MKKYIITLSILTLFLSNKCENQKNISVDVIWKNYLNTIAKKEVIDTIKTAYITDKSIYEDGSFKIERKIKFPNKMYQKVDFSDGRNEVYIYNDNQGVVIKNGIKEKMNEELLGLYKELSLIFPEFYYTEKKGDISYLGMFNEGNTEYFKIRINNNTNIDYLINKKTFELYKMVADDFEFIPVKREKTNGINIMYEANMVIGKKDTTKIKINEIIYNKMLNDTVFKIEY